MDVDDFLSRANASIETMRTEFRAIIDRWHERCSILSTALQEAATDNERLRDLYRKTVDELNRPMWRKMSDPPAHWRTRVLVIRGDSISMATYERRPYSPFWPAYSCECGWFEPDRFDAWMPVQLLAERWNTDAFAMRMAVLVAAQNAHAVERGTMEFTTYEAPKPSGTARYLADLARPLLQGHKGEDFHSIGPFMACEPEDFGNDATPTAAPSTEP